MERKPVKINITEAFELFRLVGGYRVSKRTFVLWTKKWINYFPKMISRPGGPKGDIYFDKRRFLTFIESGCHRDLPLNRKKNS